MPVGRYFLYIGGVLLALLLIVDWWLPSLGSGSAPSVVDRTTIRIHSAHKWPAAIVIDTTLPTIVPPQTPSIAAQAPPVPPPPARPVREAFALAEATPEIKPAEAAKPAKPHVRRARVARAPAGQAAGYDMFAPRNESFFGPRNEPPGFRNDFFAARSTWRW
jgi:hypothetical protein